MSLIIINNGTFDNDPSADKIRIAFDNVKANFLEQYTTMPQLDPATLAGNAGKIQVVDATGAFFELVALAGGGDLLSSNNLNDVISVSQARTNLGLGTAAEQAIAFFATAAQGALADSSVQSLTAGTDIAITGTAAIPIVSFTGTAVGVTALTFAPATGILTITLTGGGTVTEDLSAYTRLKIDGYDVIKGSGKTNFTTIEITDKISGWPSDTRYVVGVVNAIPYATAGNTDFVIDNEL